MNLLIGAISGNYTSQDISTWVETSTEWNDCTRILLLYNLNNNGSDDLLKYLKDNNINVIIPEFDFWGNKKEFFNYNTGICNLETSYDLIHNIRFYHIWYFLNDNENKFDKVLITDVKDVYFNCNPFDYIDKDKLTVTSEEVIYKNEAWNQEHIHYNLGTIGLWTLLNEQVYNVGVFGGNSQLVKEICSDIYLMSKGSHKVADQTSFNYLIQTRYKDKVKFTNLQDEFAVHLHVINSGHVKFNLNNIPNYKIVHQYDRIPGFKR
jgi:hypothetical protein